MPALAMNWLPVGRLCPLEDRVGQINGEFTPACGEICPLGVRFCLPGVSLCPPGVRLRPTLERYARPWRDLPTQGETMPAHGKIYTPMARYAASAEVLLAPCKGFARPWKVYGHLRIECLYMTIMNRVCPIYTWKSPFKSWKCPHIANSMTAIHWKCPPKALKSLQGMDLPALPNFMLFSTTFDNSVFCKRRIVDWISQRCVWGPECKATGRLFAR